MSVVNEILDAVANLRVLLVAIVGLPAFLILVKLGFISESAYTLLLITMYNLAFLIFSGLVFTVIGLGIWNLDTIMKKLREIRTAFGGVN